jgi:hypothetical protein
MRERPKGRQAAPNLTMLTPQAHCIQRHETDGAEPHLPSPLAVLLGQQRAAVLALSAFRNDAFGLAAAPVQADIPVKMRAPRAPLSAEKLGG